MSIAVHTPGTSEAPVLIPADQPPPRLMHRIEEVRLQQGISLRSAARRMGIEMRQARRQERPDADLSLSELYRWQRALEVPVAHLLVDLDAPLSTPVLKRAQMLKLMKSAVTIIEKAETEPMRRMSQRIVDQLIELMPELEDVSPWHEVGQRRTKEDYGRIVERLLPEDALYEA
ncbi:MAG: helix-turn-helix transcriptional regulator [Planctomycetes bacterium]|nr:helix-turn-helix transcriptional regulator [Planctomycetota bacterium]